jgi:heat shock protein HtpX
MMTNTLKTFVLMGILTVIVVGLGGMIGGESGLKIALFLALAMNFFSYWFSDKIVLKMYGAQEIDDHTDPEIYRTVQKLAEKAGLPVPRVYIISQPQPNAFATGRNPGHSAIAITTGIMDILTHEELEGVIGHELAHIKNRDILIGTIAATMAGVFSYLQWIFFFGGSDEEDINPLVAFGLTILGGIAATLIQMMISRSREFAADETGSHIAGNPRYLANALYKLAYASQKVPLNANPATAHMFIVNPLSGGGISKLFSTHPPIEERIEKLQTMSL